MEWKEGEGRGEEKMSQNVADHSTKFQLHGMVMVMAIIYLWMSRTAFRELEESIYNEISQM